MKQYHQIEWHKFKKEITKLENDKASGLNSAPPNVFKSMNDHNLCILFGHVQDFWDNKTDLDKWHEGQVVPIPKKDDLVDPIKWKGVNLMDIGPKCSAAYYVSDYL